MYQAAAILFIVCFSCYILFTRQPDYFEAEFTPGKVVLPDTTDIEIKAVEYPVGQEMYTVPIEGWGASQVSNGEKVTVIYNPTIPSEGSLYTFFAYWIKLPELLAGATVFSLLFVSAIFITGKNQPDDLQETTNERKRKYKD